MNTRVVHKKWIAAMMIAAGLFLQSCDKSKVSASGSSVYSNPTAIDFTPEHLVFMLKQTYANFNKAAPRSDINAILDAADDEAAKVAYDEAIDDFVDSGVMAERWKEYARSALGVGSDSGGDENRFVENLFSKVVLSGDPISDFFLSTTAVDDDGNDVTNGYMDTIPNNTKAGYATTEVWVDAYVNQFKFKAIREQIGFGLCLTFPITVPGFYEWSDDQMNATYEEGGGITCKNCHKHSNPMRFAWHSFQSNGNYNAGITRGNNQYQMEASNGGGLTLEPRDATDTPVDEAEAEASMYKMTEDGPILSTPRVLAQEITKHELFSRCMVERFLSVFLNIEEGRPGQNYVPPTNFSANEAGIAFLDEMTTKFNELDQVPKDFFKFFLKDKRYLILAVNPNDLGD
jgi:hypothetical protein